MSKSYQASSTKRRRRTKAEMMTLRCGLMAITEELGQATVRQVFYQMQALGFIDKTEAEYNNVVVRLLTEMRENGLIPWERIVDESRWMRKPRTFSSMVDALEETARYYRRDLWQRQDAYVEIWLEKNALAGIAYEVTSEYDVPLMVGVGFSSVTFLHETAMNIIRTPKPTFIYVFGDYDPSGVLIGQNVESKLRQYGAEFDFERVALTPEQIDKYQLPTRPTKRKGNTHAKGFTSDISVELDALHPDDLRRLLRDCIEQHIDSRSLKAHRKVERAERESLLKISEQYRGAS